MTKIVFASSNEHKIKEMKALLKDYEVLSLKDVGFNEDIKETGEYIIENSLIKSQTVHNFLKLTGNPLPVIADDSGLFVNSLNGEPGVNSARYSETETQKATTEKNREKLLQAMDGITDRRANYSCVITLYNDDNDIEIGYGQCFGEISYAESGNLEFGYDPLFYSYDLDEKFSECTDAEKNRVSHRARAFEDLKKHHALHFARLEDEQIEILKKTNRLTLSPVKLKGKKGDFVCLFGSTKKLFVELHDDNMVKNLFNNPTDY